MPSPQSGPIMHEVRTVNMNVDQDLTERLIEALHVEALVLADEARGYFDDMGRTERDGLVVPVDRVLFACESMKVTTRLMLVVAWLLAQRAAVAGGRRHRGDGPMRAGMNSDAATLAPLPVAARQLILASCDLYDRVVRLDAGLYRDDAQGGPARLLFGRLERAVGA